MFRKNEQLGIGIQGIITIRDICKITGDVLNEYTDKNVITEQGINTLFLRMTLPDAEDSMRFSHFKLGKDFGFEEDGDPDWGVFNPKPAEKGYTSLNQFLVYDVKETDMVFDYPDKNSFQAATLLDGKYILDTYFEDEVDMRYTSATLRFANETTFSYKRFPVRSLNRMVDVQIIWTFKFVNEYDFLCPVPPYESDLRLYSVENGLRYYTSHIENENEINEEVVITSELVDNDSTVSIVSAQPNGEVYYIKGGKRFIRINQDDEVIVNRVLSIPNNATSFDVDVFGNMYIGLDNNNGTIVKVDKDGTNIWSKNIADGRSKRVTNVWLVNNSRFVVSTKDTSNYHLDYSGNMMHILSNVTGDVIYLSTIDDLEGTSGYVTTFSSSGGELFAFQNNKVSSKKSSLIKLHYDLSEIHRVVRDHTINCAYALHDNFLCIGDEAGYIVKYDGDLNYIWEHKFNEPVKHISVDRTGRILVSTKTKVYFMTEDLDILASINNTSEPLDTSAVGRKWSYFG